MLWGLFKALGIAHSGKTDSMTIFICVALPLLFLQLYSYTRTKKAKEQTDLEDDDGGIDWQGENVSEETVDVWDGWAVLLNDVPVFEAKATAEKLEAANLRCRLELFHEDRAYHRYGNGGMGTTMCVLVAPSDYPAARAILSRKEPPL